MVLYLRYKTIFCVKEIADKIKAWSRRHENRAQFILLFACGIGCVAGFGAYLLKRLIYYIALWLHIGIGHLRIEWMHADRWLLVMPLAGILLAVLWQKKSSALQYGAQHAAYRGVSQRKKLFNPRKTDL